MKYGQIKMLIAISIFILCKNKNYEIQLKFTNRTAKFKRFYGPKWYAITMDDKCKHGSWRELWFLIAISASIKMFQHMETVDKK